MCKYILLRMKAPLQSWGGESFSYNYRATVPHPTLSGVLGLVSCAMGKNTKKEPEFLRGLVANISMDVYCYDQGSVLRDFQTAGVGHSDVRKIPTNYSGKPVVVKVRGDIYNKEYLQSSDFFVILTVQDEALASKISEGLKSPKWAPSLGRKACIPTAPLYYGESVSREDVESIMGSTMKGKSLTFSVIEGSTGESIQDVPVEFNRTYSSRKVHYSYADNI